VKQGKFLIYKSPSMIPDCIVGDFDSIRPEVQEFYSNKGSRLFKREDQDTTDLEKCLYVSLEKISESYVPENMDLIKDYSIIILGASGGRIDHTFSAYSQVYKYLENYSDQIKGIEIILFSKSSCSVYLKPGMNKIIPSTYWEKKSDGYSVIAINGECKIEVTENSDNDKFYTEKIIKFGDNFYFRKKNDANFISINVIKNTESNIAVIYSFTNIFHC